MLWYSKGHFKVTNRVCCEMYLIKLSQFWFLWIVLFYTLRLLRGKGILLTYRHQSSYEAFTISFIGWDIANIKLESKDLGLVWYLYSYSDWASKIQPSIKEPKERLKFHREHFCPKKSCRLLFLESLSLLILKPGF